MSNSKTLVYDWDIMANITLVQRSQYVAPTSKKFNGFINAMTPDEEKAFLNINENDRASKLHLADMDWSEADKSEMIQYLIEHLTTTTDDELTAADQSRVTVVSSTNAAGATLGKAAIERNAQKMKFIL